MSMLPVIDKMRSHDAITGMGAITDSGCGKSFSGWHLQPSLSKAMQLYS
jgi:hypothetical protein